MKRLAILIALLASLSGSALADSLVSLPVSGGYWWFKNNTRVPQAADIVVPVTVSPATGVTSIDLVIAFDPSVVLPTGVYGTGYANGFSMEYLIGSGQLDVHMARATPLNGSGDVAWIVFRAIGKVGNTSALSLTSASLNGGAIPAAVRSGKIDILAANVTFSSPDNAAAITGSQVDIPISASYFSRATGIDISITFDPNVIRAVSVAKTPLSQPLTLVYNVQAPGVVHIVLYGAYPISGSGDLVKIRYSVVGATGTKTPLNIIRGDIDERRLYSLPDDGLFTVTGTSLGVVVDDGVPF